MVFLSELFAPPYFAVIFSSVRTGSDAEGYDKVAARMMELAAQMDGYLGVETVGDAVNGMTVSYWRDEAAIAVWRQHPEHVEARNSGRDSWYSDFRLRVAKVERSYGMKA